MTLIDPKRVRSAVSQPVKQSPEKKVAAPTRAKVGASEFSTGRGSALRAQAPKRLTGTAKAPNDAATSANDELSRRKQNQFVPWFTTLAATVTGNPKVVTDFIASSNADAYNWLAYAIRKNGDPAKSIAVYERALALDPKHRGAHEYIGEAYLALDNLPKAKEHLARLDRLCFFSCEQYRDLKKAVEAYEKSAGKVKPAGLSK